MKRLFGLLMMYCRKCRHERVVSESKPHFCLSCGSYEVGEEEGEKRFDCKNCGGAVTYDKGWGHVIATGCVNPAVNMRDWKRFLQQRERAKK